MELLSLCVPADAPDNAPLFFLRSAPGHCVWGNPDGAPQAPAAVPPPPAPPADDMPAFLRRHAPGQPLPPINGPTVGDAIQAVNEIETRVMAALETLARRVDDLSAKMDMDPMPFDRDGAKAAIKTLEDWLRAIDNRAAHADQAAASLAAEQEALRKRLEVMAQPEAPAPRPKPEPAQDRKKAAIAAIRKAAEAKRNAVIGNSADARDVRQRLVEVALNAGTGHERSIEWLRRLADVQGSEWNDLRRMLVTEHDVATAAVVETVAVESACAMRIMSASDAEIDGLVAEAIERISRAGE